MAIRSAAESRTLGAEKARPAVLALIALSAVWCVGCDHPPVPISGGGPPDLKTFVAEVVRGKTPQDQSVSYIACGPVEAVKKLIEQKFDYACIDFPGGWEMLRKGQDRVGDVVLIPLRVWAVVPVYNLPTVKKPLCFSGEVLAKIYLGEITRWNDKQIQSLNPEIPLPDLEITIVYPNLGSAANVLWTEYLALVNPEWKKKVGVDPSPRWPIGIGARHARKKVAETPGSLTAVPFDQSSDGEIQSGLILNAKGKPTRATVESIEAAAAAKRFTDRETGVFTLINMDGEKSFPVCGIDWAIVPIRLEKAKRMRLVAFFSQLISADRDLVKRHSSGRLTPNLRKLADKELSLLTEGKK